MPLLRERIGKGQTVRFYPRGVSMLPMLRPGVDSVVLAAPPERLKKYDIPLYRREDGSYVLHRVIKAGETYTCAGDNKWMRDTGIQHGQIIAVMEGFYRADRLYSVKHFGYRMYCRVWVFFRGLWLFQYRARRWINRRIKGRK